MRPGLGVGRSTGLSEVPFSDREDGQFDPTPYLSKKAEQPGQHGQSRRSSLANWVPGSRMVSKFVADGLLGDPSAPFNRSGGCFFVLGSEKWIVVPPLTTIHFSELTWDLNWGPGGGVRTVDLGEEVLPPAVLPHREAPTGGEKGCRRPLASIRVKLRFNSRARRLVSAPPDALAGLDSSLAFGLIVRYDDAAFYPPGGQGFDRALLHRPARGGSR